MAQFDPVDFTCTTARTALLPITVDLAGHRIKKRAPANPVEDLRIALKTGIDPLGGLAYKQRKKEKGTSQWN